MHDHAKVDKLGELVNTWDAVRPAMVTRMHRLQTLIESPPPDPTDDCARWLADWQEIWRQWSQYLRLMDETVRLARLHQCAPTPSWWRGVATFLRQRCP